MVLPKHEQISYDCFVLSAGKQAGRRRKASVRPVSSGVPRRAARRGTVRMSLAPIRWLFGALRASEPPDGAGYSPDNLVRRRTVIRLRRAHPDRWAALG